MQDQVGHAVGQRVGLAGAGARDDKQRAGIGSLAVQTVFGRSALLGIKGAQGVWAGLLDRSDCRRNQCGGHGRDCRVWQQAGFEKTLSIGVTLTRLSAQTPATQGRSAITGKVSSNCIFNQLTGFWQVLDQMLGWICLIGRQAVGRPRAGALSGDVPGFMHRFGHNLCGQVRGTGSVHVQSLRRRTQSREVPEALPG